MQRFSALSDAGQNNSNGNVQALAQLWQQVRALRGTPEPDAAHLAGFVAGLNTPERGKIEDALAMAVRGREQPGDFSLISWAASCTRPALLAHLAGHGLGFTGSELFSCGLVLREQGWDIQARVAQLANNPADVATLRAMLPGASEVSARQAEPSPESWPASWPDNAPPDEQHDDAPLDEARPDNTPPDDDTAPDWPDESMDLEAMEGPDHHWADIEQWDATDAMETTTTIDKPQAFPASSASSPETSKSSRPLKNTAPTLPTRFEREVAPLPFYFAAPSPAAASPKTRKHGGKNGGTPDPQLQPKLRLFGKSAAHTLEVTDHRRGGDFMGTHVVSIDSAAAHGTDGTYAWERKLVVQLTPEEMPAIVATLMGLTPSARFGNHGADKSKFIEVRRQEGGLVIVTGDKAGSYSVPVPTHTAYYVLDLFCRAMARDGSGRCVSDIVALVRAVYGF